MPSPRKPRDVLEVRGYAFGREAIKTSHFPTVNKAIDYMQKSFATTRGLVCFLESGTLHPDDTFVMHENGISLRLTTVLRSATAAA
jgi:hypothetical protein